MPYRTLDFQTIHSHGGLLPPDLLRRILDTKETLDGARPEFYALPPGDRLNEVISQSWNRLCKYWSDFRNSISQLTSGEPATGVTNDRWTLPLLRELGFGLLPATSGPVINGRTYPISRFFGPVPIHLVGCGLSLDRRAAGVRGASSSNPHGLVQEFLNRSAAHLWGIVSNGNLLRILRDSQALSRQSYLEFDLDAMFAGEVYSDFVLLWMTAHATRFLPREDNRPDTCWLERWTRLANEQGTRALQDLRGGVERALQCLGEGFTSHPKNTDLREALRSGTLSPADFHGQLLRIIYRLIFLFVAEDRTIDGHPVLHPLEDSSAAEVARDRYRKYYSLARLREVAEQIRGSRHGDLWKQFQFVSFALSGLEQYAVIRQKLALPALGSFLWKPSSIAALNSAEITNHDFLDALRNLAFTRQGAVLRQVDYKNLGAEELGGVYESLLALTPQVSADGARFTFAEFAGNERKTSGSYYTPDSLVQCLLDSALDPVVEHAIKDKPPHVAAQAILELKVCDPAVGSGHFLVGAAHRLARHLARQRSLALGESEPSPLLYQHSLREVISRCLYGVDVKSMSAELCRVSLWLEALEPGKPLSFLDHHIQVGNSLLGSTRALLGIGIPDEAFSAIEGDDKEICRRFKRVNRDERLGQKELFAPTTEPWDRLGNIAESMARLDCTSDESLEEIEEKQRLYEELVRSGDYLNGQFLADTWCAAFVWKKNSEFKYPITEEVFRRIEHNPHGVDTWMRDEIVRLSKQYQFFHWHLAFPEIFTRGGFDCVLGNPPWERVKLQEKEWFSTRSEAVMNAPNAAARKKAITQVKAEDPSLYSQFLAATREAEAESHLIRNGGRFKLCIQGDLNTYSLFTELLTQLLRDTGRGGIIVPTGIATDDSNSDFFSLLVREKKLVSLFDFENRERVLFPEVYYRMRFCLLTICSSARPCESPVFTFFALKVEDLTAPNRVFSVSSSEIQLINPNTNTCPIFHSERDAVIMRRLYEKVPVLWLDNAAASRNSWGIAFARSFHMTNDSNMFISEDFFDETWIQTGNVFSQDTKEYLPLYEGRMIDIYDHRLASTRLKEIKLQRSGESVPLTSTQKANPSAVARPRYWVSAVAVETMAKRAYQQGWVLGCMSITSATNARTSVMSIIPLAGLGNSVIGILSEADAKHQCCLLATFCSLPFDYVCKQKVSGNNFNMFIIKQLPVLPPSAFDQVCPWDTSMTILEWIVPRVIELTYTANDLRRFASDVGFTCEPFKWDDARRYLLRCELDAAFLHLLDIDRDASVLVTEAFSIVRSREEEEFGEYKSKRILLEMYDGMSEAIRSSTIYRTRLFPPPADGAMVGPELIATKDVTDLQSTTRMALESVPDAAWATPAGISPEHIALFALIDVLRKLSRPDYPEKIRIAAFLVRSPALARAFMNEKQAKEWIRVVGEDAMPSAPGVIEISQFQHNVADNPWADAISRLKGSEAIITDQDGKWSIGPKMPLSSGQDWVIGRASVAVQLISEIDVTKATQKVIAFARSVENGTSRRAVS